MKSLPVNVILEKNKIASNSAWLVLLEIKLNNTSNTTFRLVRNTEDITYDGEVYTAFPFELDTSSTDSDGSLPSIDLKVSNITHVLQPYLLDLRGGIGSTVTVRVVNSALLTEDYSELEMEFLVTASHSERSSVTFRLGAANPLTQRFPLFRYIGLHCRWRFGSVECGYTGFAIATIDYSAISNPFVSTSVDHNFVTGDIIRIYGLETITGLDGDLTVTVYSNRTFSVENVLGSQLTPTSHTGADGAGMYARNTTTVCSRTLKQCRVYGRSASFGGFPGMRSRSLRIV